MLYFVYTIENAVTGEVGYVGITNNPGLRLHHHLGGKEANGKKNAWLQQLLANDIEPKMRILEIVDGSQKEAKEREKYWMQHYVSQQAPLTNVVHVKSMAKALKGKVEIVKVVKKESKNRWLNTYQACSFSGIHWKGTQFLYLAEEFGLNKRTVNNTTYYSSKELEKFVVWLDKQYPGLRRCDEEEVYYQ